MLIDGSKHPKLIKRYPREVDVNKLPQEVFQVEAKILKLINGPLHGVHMELGREFRKLKALVTKNHGHGAWQPYYDEHLQPQTGYSLRTIQNWMRQAKEADEAQKRSKVSFLAARHRQAVKVRQATQAAIVEISKAPRREPPYTLKPSPRFNSLTPEQRVGAEGLWKQPAQRALIEQEFAAVLIRMMAATHAEQERGPS